jgi:hypothetical protein
LSAIDSSDAGADLYSGNTSIHSSAQRLAPNLPGLKAARRSRALLYHIPVRSGGGRSDSGACWTASRRRPLFGERAVSSPERSPEKWTEHLGVVVELALKLVRTLLDAT